MRMEPDHEPRTRAVPKVPPTPSSTVTVYGEMLGIPLDEPTTRSVAPPTPLGASINAGDKPVDSVPSLTPLMVNASSGSTSLTSANRQ